MKSKLMPCPNNCGLSAIEVVEDWSWGIQTFQVQCFYCGCSGIESKDRDQAIKNWNERRSADDHKAD